MITLLPPSHDYSFFFTALVSGTILLSLAGRAENAPATPAIGDARLLSAGSIIPSEGYSDQPYIVQTGEGGRGHVLTLDETLRL